MPTLGELRAEFLRHEVREDGSAHIVSVATIDKAMGVRFLCPRCLVAPEPDGGIHCIVCWSGDRGAPADALPGPSRWSMRGTGIDDLTLDGENGKPRTVYLDDPLPELKCVWQGTVTKGKVE